MLRHADGRARHCSTARPVTSSPPASAAPPSGCSTPTSPTPLRARLADVIEMRALTPVARVRSRELPLAVLNDDGKTVVRLQIETHAGLHGRISATAVRGYDRDLERVDVSRRC